MAGVGSWAEVWGVDDVTPGKGGGPAGSQSFAPALLISTALSQDFSQWLLGHYPVKFRAAAESRRPALPLPPVFVACI